MILADEIREFIDQHYIAPARLSGHSTVTINVGDVHRKMQLKNRAPAVCGALRSSRLHQQCGLQLVSWNGPDQGTSVNVTFDLVSTYDKSSSPARKAPPAPPRAVVSADDLSRWRRQLLRILDTLDKRPVAEEGAIFRINRLSREGRVPREIAALMKVVAEVRNVSEHEGRPISDTVGAAAMNSWNAVREWAVGNGMVVDRN